MRNKRKHLPIKNSQTNRIRALLLNINEGIAVANTDFGIDKSEFCSYFLALEQTGYILLKQGAEQFSSTSYIILDIEKYDNLKNNAYRLIPKIILPVLSSYLTKQL